MPFPQAPRPRRQDHEMIRTREAIERNHTGFSLRGRKRDARCLSVRYGHEKQLKETAPVSPDAGEAGTQGAFPSGGSPPPSQAARFSHGQGSVASRRQLRRRRGSRGTGAARRARPSGIPSKAAPRRRIRARSSPIARLQRV